MSSIRRATILVLEENAAVQELVEQALKESGHRVLSTKNSLEALEVVRRVRVDVLVVGDLIEHPRQTVVDELLSIQPAIGVVGICGVDDDLRQTDLIARLQTPFSLDELRAVISADLARARAGL